MARTTFSGPVRSLTGFTGTYLTFDTATVYENGQGTIAWDPEAGTLYVDLGDGVKLQVGQELFFTARNNTGSDINKGEALQFSGALGNSGRITVQLAQAAAATPPEYFVGIAAQDILDGTDGLVTYFGKLRGIDTRGGGENWQDGDILYLSGSSAGALTKTPPTAPTPDILVAAVVNAATNGILLIRPTFPTSLAQLTDVNITNPQNGDILTYNSSLGVWENSAP